MSFLSDLDLSRIPQHVGIVMDGNGRWARQRGLPRTEGHKMGEEALFDTVEGALEIGLPWLTVYGFSTENWRRPRDEVRFLMNFNRSLLRRRRDELHERGVRILFTGRRDWRVPRGVLREFGLELAEDVEVRVWDSTAEVRYLVLPERPAGSENLNEDALAALVTRDSMVGVAKVTLSPAGGGA